VPGHPPIFGGPIARHARAQTLYATETHKADIGVATLGWPVWAFQKRPLYLSIIDLHSKFGVISITQARKASSAFEKSSPCVNKTQGSEICSVWASATVEQRPDITKKASRGDPWRLCTKWTGCYGYLRPRRAASEWPSGSPYQPPCPRLPRRSSSSSS
jgi:hypothetical protein